MPLTECIHGMLAGTCTLCRRLASPPTQIAERVIAARYPGRCNCGEPIEEGDLIGLVDGEWVCEECFTPA
ncbi:MAG TPA: hypothetical protein VM328_10955 [Fimbriimonadaceae bacterium]|nr:hypothetical protein [Fimbriimonadaceae bacterium]